MRFANYLSDMDCSKRTLEIGPLCDPILRKNEADVYYADMLSTQEVKELYKDEESVDKDAICTIDFVIRESYTKACVHVEKFDYIIKFYNF